MNKLGRAMAVNKRSFLRVHHRFTQQPESVAAVQRNPRGIDNLRLAIAGFFYVLFLIAQFFKQKGWIKKLWGLWDIIKRIKREVNWFFENKNEILAEVFDLTFEELVEIGQLIRSNVFRLYRYVMGEGE